MPSFELGPVLRDLVKPGPTSTSVRVSFGITAAALSLDYATINGYSSLQLLSKIYCPLQKLSVWIN